MKIPHRPTASRSARTASGLALCAASCLLLGLPPGAAAIADVKTVGSAARVVGPQECAECHEEEFAAWNGSAHHVASTVLTRSEEARSIAKELGIRRLKTDERCTRCHFTMQARKDELASVAGVSCESCHGPAAGWLRLHDDFGGAEVTRAMETEPHRAERLERCSAAGMRHPDRLAEVAASCYECHVVGDADLVAAGHPTGEGFELVAWSQGEIRHNYVRGEGENREASVERRRVMYALGRLLELEYALRSLDAHGRGSVAAARLGSVAAALDEIARVAGVPEVGEALALARSGASTGLVEAAAGPAPHTAGLAGLADRVHECAVRFEEREHGAGLAALDALLPPPSAYVGAAPR